MNRKDKGYGKTIGETVTRHDANRAYVSNFGNQSPPNPSNPHTPTNIDSSSSSDRNNRNLYKDSRNIFVNAQWALGDRGSGAPVSVSYNPHPQTSYSILFYSILFYSILFYSILSYPILSYH